MYVTSSLLYTDTWTKLLLNPHKWAPVISASLLSLLDSASLPVLPVHQTLPVWKLFLNLATNLPLFSFCWSLFCPYLHIKIKNFFFVLRTIDLLLSQTAKTKIFPQIYRFWTRLCWHSFGGCCQNQQHFVTFWEHAQRGKPQTALQKKEKSCLLSSTASHTASKNDDCYCGCLVLVIPFLLFISYCCY